MPTPNLTLAPSQLGRNENASKQPPTAADVTTAATQEFRGILDFIEEQAHADVAPSFMDIERQLRDRLLALGRLLVILFLTVFEGHVSKGLGCVVEINGQRYRRRPRKGRNLMTLFGVVRYFRTYLRRRPTYEGNRSGHFPTDALLGLTKDRASMGILSLGAYLSTKVSYAQASECLRRTIAVTPSTEVLQRGVLGLGSHVSAYLEQAPAPAGDGEVLVLQFDGKGAPTVTRRELELRRGPRDKGLQERCKRHRGRAQRKKQNRKERRLDDAKDPSKNAKEVTVLVIYTLSRSEKDGRLHGPINKRVYASFDTKDSVFSVARREAIKRGFDPDSDTNLIHVITDGDAALARRVDKEFRHAVHTIDIMHVLEYVWSAGRVICSTNRELRAWTARQKERLLCGRVDEVLSDLDFALERMAPDTAGLKAVETSLKYILRRSDKLDYGWLLARDLDIASGAVEGAVKHIVGLRFDNGGMRWIPERAEALLKLRCVAFNGDWDDFIEYVDGQVRAANQKGGDLRILTNTPEPLEKFANAA
jgi:hypothetical protein